MRGHLDQLEKTLNEIVTELEYHNSQLQITRSDKETAGAQLDIGAVACQNEILNQQYRSRQEIGNKGRAQKKCN